jgi:hypothetical protein
VVFRRQALGAESRLLPPAGQPTCVLSTRICARILGQLLLRIAPNLVERPLRTAEQAYGMGFGDAGNSEQNRAMGLGILRFIPRRGLSGRQRSLKGSRPH